MKSLPFPFQQVGINLSGHIVIFDEAHNIENTACDSVSFVISKEQLESAREDLTMLGAFWVIGNHRAENSHSFFNQNRLSATDCAKYALSHC